MRAVGGVLGCLRVRWGKHEWVVWDECCRDETDVWHRRDCLRSHVRVGSEDVQMWEKSLDISWRDGWHLRFSTSHYSPRLPEICKGFPFIAVRLTSKFDSFFFFSFFLLKQGVLGWVECRAFVLQQSENSQVFGEAFLQYSDSVLTITKQACTLPRWIIILIKRQVSPYAVSASFLKLLFLDLSGVEAPPVTRCVGEEKKNKVH